MSNRPVAGSSRTIYVSSGDKASDDSSGLTREEAVRTAGEAAIKVAQFTPTLLTPASIIGLDASTLFLPNPLNVPDFVQCGFDKCIVIGEINSGDALQITCQTLVGNYSTSGAQRTGFTSGSVITETGSSITVNGASDENFISVNQVVLRGDNLIGLDYTATGQSSESISIEVTDIGGLDNNGSPVISNDCKGIYINEPTNTNIYLSNGKVRDNGGTGNAGVWIEKGKVVDSNRFINMSAGNTAILLNSADADYTLISPEVNGDIFTSVGSKFYPNITRYSGNALLLGDVNGIIGGVKYGSYKEGNTLYQSFFYSGNIRPQEQEAGVFSFDTTQDTLTVLDFTYLQTTTNSRTVNVSLVDAGDPLIVYYTASNVGNTVDIQTGSINVGAPVTPLPSGNVNMVILVNRNGGGGQSGVMDFTLITERER